MKRIITAAMVLILALTLCACDVSANTGSTPTPSNPDQPTANAPTPNNGQGDVIDDPIPAGADDVIMQGVFYYELVEMSGDYGDGLSPREGAELVNDLLADIGFYSGNGIPAGQCVYISLDELAILDAAMGRECYIYSVGLGTAEGGLMGNNYEVVYRVSVDYSGNKTAAIYEDFNDGYEDDVTHYEYEYSLRLDFGLDGLEWDSGNEYTLDGEVKVYSGTLGGGNDLGAQIEEYLRLQNYMDPEWSEVSEWLSLEENASLSKAIGYPVWIAEYYVGYEEDTALCVDAVVLARDYALIIHTIRDADLDMNTEIDFGARIMELFAAIEVVTV